MNAAHGPDFALLDEVRRAQGLVENAATAPFASLDLQSLIDAVAAMLGEPIVLLEGPANPGAETAAWARVIDPDGRTVNYLIADGGLDDLLFRRSVLHELGHMVFGDPAVDDPEPVDMAPLGLPGTCGTVMRRRGCARDTEDPCETRAELFAALAAAPAPQRPGLPPGLRRLLRSLEAGG